MGRSQAIGIRKLLVANRGEIAVRIIRAARELGIRAVAAHSSADAQSLAVQMADESVEIGPPPAARSYLQIDALIEAARSCGADAIHPGYGFLAENADFADAVAAAGLVFVGPRGETIRSLGDKVAAREAAVAAGIPTVPGSEGRVADSVAARDVAARIGFPVLIKAAAGGGGRGIRIAGDAGALARLLPQAGTEARAAFGDGGVYIEKAIPDARHIEVQLLGDGERVIHCYERECSLQRRRQKLWEEAPAPLLSAPVRDRICAAAVALGESVGYRGAGTVEFLYDGRSESFYFLEMNTRIQVEHPITECVTGIDLVREMLRIAAGEGLKIRQEEVVLAGHAIECRINAEDPTNGFAPGPGRVESLGIPGGPGVRFDTLLYAGCEVPPFYDSLLGKLVVWDRTRADALDRLERALAELRVEGLHTTKPLHQALARDEQVRDGRVHTAYLEQWLEQNAASIAEFA